MSSRSERKHNPDDPKTWNLKIALFEGTDAIVATTEAIRRLGAKQIALGWLEKDCEERWPDQYITAWCKVRYTIQAGIKLGRYFDYVEVVCEKGTAVDSPAKAIMTAMAEIIKKHGGNVTIA